MQDLFRSISFSEKDILNEWNKTHKVKFLIILDSDDFMKERSQPLLESLEIIISKTAACDVESMEYVELEPTYLDIFKTVANELTKDDVSYNNINKFIELFQLISNEHEKVTLFKLLGLGHLFFLLRDRNYFELINDDHTGILFGLLEIKIDSELYCYYEIKNEWKYTVEDFLVKFGGISMRKSLLFIQKFYEFMITNPCDSYSKCCQVLIKKVDLNEELNCESVYSNLVKENLNTAAAKVDSLLTIFKETAISENFDRASLFDFTRQFIVLFNYTQANFGDHLFTRLHMPLHETIFEVFIKVKDNDTRKLCFYVINNLKSHSKQLRQEARDALTLYVINSLKLLSNHYFNLESFNYQKVLLETEKTKYLEIFEEFLDVFVRSILNLARSPGLIKPIISLVLTLLKLPLRENILSQLTYLLKKEAFYHDFQKCPSKAINITNQILNVLSSFISESKPAAERDETEQQKYELISLRLRDLADSFTDQIVKNKILCADLYENVLFDRIVCKPVEERVLVPEFYQTIRCFTSLVSFSKFPSEPNDMERLRSVYAIAVSHEILDQIQPYFMAYFKQPALHYLDFYKKMSVQILEEQSYATLFETDVMTLLNAIERHNQFYDIAEKPTLDFYILVEYTKGLLSRPNTSELLVEKVISICFKVYAKYVEFKSVFDTMVALTSLKYPQHLAKNSDAIFKYFINSDNSSEYSYQLNSIFPYINPDVFNLHANELFDKIIRYGPQNFNNKNVVFLNAIAECVPEFYLTRQINDELRLVTLQTMVLETKSAYFINCFLNIVNIVVEKCETKRHLEESHLEEFYSSRTSFYRLVFIDVKSKFRPDILELIEGCHLVHLMHSLCNLYVLVYQQTGSDEIKRGLIEDMFEIYSIIKRHDCAYIFNAFMRIVTVDEGQANLLKVHFKQLKTIYRYDSSPDIRDQVKILCEIIAENTSRRSSLNSISIETFDLNTKSKVAEAEPTEEPQQEETSDTVQELGKAPVEGGFVNAPSWSEELCIQIQKADHWTYIAEKLNFSDTDISTWNNHSNPTESMLKEWFLTKKKPYATLGLLEVFKELKMQEYVDLIERYSKRVEQLSRKNSYDEELDAPHVLINFERSSAERARVLKQDLEKLDLVVWLDESKMDMSRSSSSSKSSRSHVKEFLRKKSAKSTFRLERGLRSCQLLISLATEEAPKDQSYLDMINSGLKSAKPMIFLIIDPKIKWPPNSPSDLNFGELYFYMRFYKRNSSAASRASVKSDRIVWPENKFNELKKEIKKIMQPKLARPNSTVQQTPNYVVFISYQLDNKDMAIELAKKLKECELTCWLDVEQVDYEKDSVYEKTELALRNSKLMVCLMTHKYVLSIGSRKEVELAASKPIIPVLLQANMKYPPMGPMSQVINSKVKYQRLSDKETEWTDYSLKELIESVKATLSLNIDEINHIEQSG